MNEEFFAFDIEAEPGDLVSVDGYGDRIFQVEIMRLTRVCSADEEYNEMAYELVDCGNGEWLEADSDDLLLLADAGQADEFLRENPAPVVPTVWPFMDFSDNINGGGEMKKPEKKPTARELSSQEAARRKAERKDRAQKIDAALDWMNYYREAGDEAKVAEVKRELAELVGDSDSNNKGGDTE